MSKVVLFTPGSIFLLGVGGWFLTYGIGISDPQHLVRLPDWPTISNTGSFPPESCVFSQLLNTTAIIGLFVHVVFFKYVQAVGADDSLGKATAVLGVIQMFGVMLVGNFQFTSIRFVHFFGATLAFGCGLALALCISIMSAGKLCSPRWLVWTRIGITAIAFLSGIIMLVSAFQQGDPAEDDYSRFWANMTDAFEWSLGISLLFFYFSLTYEFSKIKSTKLSITLDTVKEQQTVLNGDCDGRTSLESQF